MASGRIPGNLPIELIADYMNEYFGGHYNIDDLMDAIQDHIAPIKATARGATPRRTSCRPGSICTATMPSITLARAI